MKIGAGVNKLLWAWLEKKSDTSGTAEYGLTDEKGTGSGGGSRQRERCGFLGRTFVCVRVCVYVYMWVGSESTG